MGYLNKSNDLLVKIIESFRCLTRITIEVSGIGTWDTWDLADYLENSSGWSASSATRLMLLVLLGVTGPVQPVTSILPSSSVTLSGAGAPNALHDILKTLPPALAAFAANLPSVEGPSPDVDFVISVCLQSNIPLATGKSMGPAQQAGPAPSTSDLSGSTKYKSTRDRHAGKRKDLERQENDDTTVQSQPIPRDVFKLRQLQKSRGTTTSHTGSASYGSAFSGELSGSTG